MKKSAKMWLRVLALVMALLLLGSSTVFAADMDSVPYYSYCYWEGPSRYQAIPMRAMYEAEVEIDADSLGLDTALVNPQFLALSQDKTEVYILDSGNLSQGNSRIVVFDAQTYELIREIGGCTVIVEDMDCGIAMASGAQAASQVAQLVLTESDFAAMPAIVGEGRRVINNIQRAATLFLVKNIFSLFVGPTNHFCCYSIFL